MSPQLSVLFALLFAAPFIPQAFAQQSPLPSEFCYEARCYPSLAQAEADMRASTGVYGPLWRLNKVNRTGVRTTGDVLQYSYKVDHQPPEVVGPDEYRVGGGQPYPSEESGIEALLQRLRAGNPQCEIIRVGMVGGHGEPYVRVQGSGRTGTVFDFSNVGNDPQPNKYVQIQSWCAAWSPPSPPRIDKFWVPRQHNVECAEGFLIKEGSNPQYVPGSADLDWPNICRPARDSAAIQAYNIKQTASCSINSNPCYPATGDKARAEPDFVFAGQQFVRYYHSLNQLQAAKELGTGWSHSYADFILPGSSGESRADERGYLQTYRGGRGKQASGELLRTAPDGASELVQANGTARSYNSDGRLIRVSNVSPGTSATVTYDKKGRIDRITDGLGRALVFAYEGKWLSAITLPDGSQARYSYDSSGNLTEVIRPDGSSRTYVYAEPGLAPAVIPNLLTGIVEGSTRYATFSYGSNGKVTGSRLHASGLSVDATSVIYNADGTATSINSLGDVKLHVIAGQEFSAITRTTDAQGLHSFNYDDLGRLTSTVDPLGNRTAQSYVDSNGGLVSQLATRTEESIGRITRTTRDASNRVVEERISQRISGGERLSALNRQVYDAQGRALFSCQYDSNQNTDYVCGSLAIAPSNVRQTQNTYCSEAEAAANPMRCPLPGLQLTAINPVGAITRFEYHAANDSGCDTNGECRFRKGDMRAEIDPLGRRTEYLEYDAFGRAVQVRGIDGVVVEQLFDHNARVLAETIKGDVPANDRIRLYEYNSTGKLTRVTQPDGVWTRMHYDTADRLSSVEDVAGNRINYVLDGAGNRVREEVRDSSGVLRRVLDRLFDTASRMTRVTGASGQATQLRYDAVGNMLETENPVGTISKSTYDGVGRPTRQIDDLGGINAEMRYEYAANGQVERVVDPKGLATTYAYDGFGQLVTQTSPDTGITQFTYDRLGNTLTRTDARGVTAQYEYDAIGRTAAVRFADPAADIQYVYDQPSSQCPAGERAGIGRLSSMIDPSGRTDYCYSPVGDLVRRVQVVEGQALVLRYAYAPSGRLQSMTYPDGSLVDYGYDTLGQVNSVGVTPAGGTREVLLQGVQTLPFGPVQSWTFGNGRRLDRSYDLDYRPVSISDGRDGLNVAFGFDDAGNIASLTDGGPQGQGAYLGYDALGRLIALRDAESGVAIEEYSYDATGNRLSFGNSIGTQAYSYPADSHRLASVDGVARTYDPMGNTLTIGGEWRYAYDLAGRIGSATQTGVATSIYHHNAAGLRTSQQSEDGTTLHLYGEGGQWLGSYRTNGIPTRQVVWVGSRPVGMIHSGKLLYLETDHLGSSRIAVDPARDATVWRWSMLGEAFGYGAMADDPDQDGVLTEIELRFPGQRKDEDSGLIYNHFRDYDSRAGRYLQSDPLGLRGGSTSYAYAASNPLRNVDPLGLIAWHGYAHGYGVAAGAFAFARYNFHLISECVNGKRAVVDLDVGFAGGGIGSPATYTVSNVSLEDGMSEINLENITGPASMYGGGFSIGGGASYSGFRLGKAYSESSWAGQGGWDASVYGYPVGYSSLDGVPRIFDCGCGL
ncbi:RHS repeat-associated protein [Stenotrophomonas rhizophila]|uniref:RHS repeat-associated core domain-containing protein n=1 Tax=Stenotrophomonas rhizophila TaxID=216778 RepID=UPI00339B2C24